LPRTYESSIVLGRAGEGVANGTLGELVQGQTVAGEDFLVTFPVAFWSKARAVINDSGIVIGPRDKSKARRMASLVLQRLGLASAGAVLEVQCGVPEGKGCASSTADVVAAARAVCDATQLSLEPGEIAELAVEIEPSDGVMWDGVVAFNHRAGRLLRHLGKLPPVRIIGIDLGGHVDTVQFNRRPKDYSPQERRMCQEALEQVAAAIDRSDVQLLGEACTRSARIHQRVLPKPELPGLIDIVEQTGGAGVSIAHSGTVCGLLYDPARADAAERALTLVLEGFPNARELVVEPLPGSRPIRADRLHARE
jgi:L-threonine kinase